MSLIVCKFGGTSLANSSQQLKVKQIVEADPNRKFVVVSAPGKRSKDDQKITDLLLLCHEHAKQKLPFDDVFSRITERYKSLISEHGLSLDLTAEFTAIKTTIADIDGIGAKPDFAASRGEYLNSLIIGKLMDWPVLDAAEVIFFKKNGQFDTDKTYEMLSAKLKEMKQAVIPGFYGSSPDGSIKTFSRGGSDITGAIVARAAGADIYENWTDVAGMLAANPQIVENARPIKTITYRELRELAYMGATVLHDEAIFPVKQAGIPVNIRSTNEPDQPGSMIIPEETAEPAEHPVTGIAGKKHFHVITIEKALMNQETGFGRRVLTVLEANDISFEHMPSGIDTLSLVISADQLENNMDTVVEELRGEVKPDRLDVIENLALIATVGRGMAETPGTAAKLFNALGDADINIHMIDQGSSEQNIIIGVKNDDFDKAIKAIYNVFDTEQ